MRTLRYPSRHDRQFPLIRGAGQPIAPLLTVIQTAVTHALTTSGGRVCESRTPYAGMELSGIRNVSQVGSGLTHGTSGKRHCQEVRHSRIVSAAHRRHHRVRDHARKEIDFANTKESPALAHLPDPLEHVASTLRSIRRESLHLFMRDNELCAKERAHLEVQDAAIEYLNRKAAQNRLQNYVWRDGDLSSDYGKRLAADAGLNVTYISDYLDEREAANNIVPIRRNDTNTAG